MMKHFICLDLCAGILLSLVSTTVFPFSSTFPPQSASVNIADKPCMPALKSAFQYYWGQEGIKKDRVKARAMFEKLAERGCPSAQSTLGIMYAFGFGGVQDLSLAIHWTQRAADQNDLTALTQLGRLYLNGRIVKKDSAKAYSLLERAALQGEPEAQCLLGMLQYKEGDKNKGLLWIQTAAANGNSIAKAFLDNIKKAEFVKKHGTFSPSTENARPLACSENPVWQEKVTRAFFLKDGRNPDFTLIASGPNPQGALRLLEEVASEGCAEAQMLIGNSYYYGFFGGVVDKKKSMFWLKKAAQQGSVEAKQQLEEIEDN